MNLPRLTIKRKGKNVSENTSRASSSGIGFGGFLFLLFLGLKLTHYIDWSWWWITAPLWIPICIVFAILAFVLGIALLVAVCKN